MIYIKRFLVHVANNPIYVPCFAEYWYGINVATASESSLALRCVLKLGGAIIYPISDLVQFENMKKLGTTLAEILTDAARGF